MPIPKAVVIQLSPGQKTILTQLSNRRKNPYQLVIRAKIILSADAGVSNQQIAANLSIGRSTVIRWRQRWVQAAPHLASIEPEVDEPTLSQQISSVLSDEERSGAPATFTAEQICQILAVACERPTDCGCPVSHWAPRELANKVISRGIVPAISPRHVGRFLKSGRT